MKPIIQQTDKLKPLSIRFLAQEYGKFRKEIVQYFIDEAISHSKFIIDPMCGSASILPYTQIKGITSIYSDIIPIHYYVNRAKTIDIWQELISFEINEHISINEFVTDFFSSLKNTSLQVSDNWFPEDVYNGLCLLWENTEKYSSFISIFLKAFIILSLSRFSSKWTTYPNPYWHRPGGITSSLSVNDIINEILQKFNILWEFYKAHYNKEFKLPQSDFLIEDIANIKIKNKCDTIITSPAYPNRFDYLRMYAPEMNFLKNVKGPHNAKMDFKLLATNSVVDYEVSLNDLQYISNFSVTASNFLNHVLKLGKKRENNYYHRYFTLYYFKLFKAIENMKRMLKGNGSIYIVVQDNMHRGELNPLAKCCEECLGSIGFNVHEEFQKWLRTHQGTRNKNSIFAKRHYETIVSARLQ